MVLYLGPALCSRPGLQVLRLCWTAVQVTHSPARQLRKGGAVEHAELSQGPFLLPALLCCSSQHPKQLAVWHRWCPLQPLHSPGCQVQGALCTSAPQSSEVVVSFTSLQEIQALVAPQPMLGLPEPILQPSFSCHPVPPNLDPAQPVCLAGTPSSGGSLPWTSLSLGDEDSSHTHL